MNKIKVNIKSGLITSKINKQTFNMMTKFQRDPDTFRYLNTYVPMDSLELANSLKVQGNRFIWDAPYARRQYYDPAMENKISVRNSNGRWRWLEPLSEDELVRLLDKHTYKGVNIYLGYTKKR